MNAQQTYRAHVEAHTAREKNRLEALAQLRRQYDQQVATEQERIAAQHAEIDAFQKDLQAGLPRAIVDYFTMILASSVYPEKFPQKVKLAYVPESKQLVVEDDLPTFEIVPEVCSYKYVKTKDSITETSRPTTTEILVHISNCAGRIANSV